MSPRVAGSLVAGLALIAALAGCGPSTVTSTSATSEPNVHTMENPLKPLSSASATAASADPNGLVAAQHPQCDYGRQILHYLATGNNGGDPSMDQVFANYVGVPTPQARALADKWITACDQQAASQAAAAASSAAQAQVEASYQAATSASRAAASASAASLAAAKRRSCAAIGGQSTGTLCQSASPGSAANDRYYPCSSVYVEFTEDGTIDQSSYTGVNTDHPGCFR